MTLLALLALVSAVVLARRGRPLIPPSAGVLGRMSDRWIFDNIYAQGKSGDR
jgi:hypothetical protein